MTTKNYKFPPEVQEWIDIVEQDKFKCCEEQHLLVEHVRHCFETEAIHIDEDQLKHYMHLCDAYLPFSLFPWQKFAITLHDCTYWDDTGQPRWPDLFCMLGRGAGKDGTIATESFLMTSPYNGIREYDVDICANNEEQAVRPAQDLIGFFEAPSVAKKIKKFYHWTKEKITCIKTRSVIKGRTNSPKGKDGLRSGIVIFNEIHQYPNYDNINVFTTGLGKKKHPRRSYYTTNGNVREGPLDDILKDGDDVLRGGVADNGTLYFICKLDDKEEVHDEANWPKANPSLPYLPDLLLEIRKEYREWKKSPERLPAFMSKRMNLPERMNDRAVTEWENVIATNKELPNLRGWSCVVGIDYASTSDWVGVDLHFKKGDERYDVAHAWICSESKDLSRIKAPWREWVKRGLCTYVEDVEIHPSVISAYIAEQAKLYNIRMVCIDRYRYTLLSDALSKVGFSFERKNLYLVRQVDILAVTPVINSCFVNKYFSWGDNPVLRWCTGNTKLVPYGKAKGDDKGSFVYAKIESKSRKTDAFMALVAAMVKEDEIKERPTMTKVGVITF